MASIDPVNSNGADKRQRSDRQIEKRDWLLKAIFYVPLVAIGLFALLTTIAVRETDKTLIPVLGEARSGNWASNADQEAAARNIVATAVMARKAEQELPYVPALSGVPPRFDRLIPAANELAEIKQLVLPGGSQVQPGSIAEAVRKRASVESMLESQAQALREQLMLQSKRLDAARLEINRLSHESIGRCGAGQTTSGGAVIPNPHEQQLLNCSGSMIGDKKSPFQIYFNTGRAQLTPNTRVEIARIVDAWRQQNRPQVFVTGYTDAVGTSTSNKRLRNARALIVARALESESNKEMHVEIVATEHFDDNSSGPSNEGDERERYAQIAFKPIGKKDDALP